MSTKPNNEVNADEPLGELVEALENVDENSPNAELNATTISDNNGRRIELDRNKLQGLRPVQGIFTDNQKFEKIDPK